MPKAIGHFHRLQPAIVHRDLKPANILRDKQNLLRITDFGISGIAARQMIENETRGTTTRAGRLQSYLYGSYTPLYASPQQRDGAESDPRDDVHALGVIGFQMLTGQLNQGVGPDFADELKEMGVDERLIELLRRCTATKAERRPKDAAEVASALGNLFDEPGAQMPAFAAPLVVNITAIPAPQVAASDLPPLPQDILALEGQLNGLQQTIKVIELGQHPDLRGAWKALDGQSTPTGQLVLEALKQRIEQTPSCRDSELCALAPDAPQWAVLVVINSLKRLVEIKRERAEVEQKLAKRQEEDFRVILARFLAQSEEEQFPLAVWMKLEPLLSARRYVFVRSVRELLHKAEEHFTAIRAEQEVERARRNSEREERGKQEQEVAAWSKAEQLNTAEAYEEYLNTSPTRHRADQARQLAAKHLRAVLLRDLGNKGVRQRYLRFRTTEQLAADEAGGGGWSLTLPGAFFGALFAGLLLFAAIPAIRGESTVGAWLGFILPGVAVLVCGYFQTCILGGHSFDEASYGSDDEKMIGITVIVTLVLDVVLLFSGSIGIGAGLATAPEWVLLVVVPLTPIAVWLFGGLVGAVIGSSGTLRYESCDREPFRTLCMKVGAIGLLAGPVGAGLGWLKGNGSLAWLLLFAAAGGLAGCLSGLLLGMDSKKVRGSLARKYGPIPWWMLTASEKNKKRLGE